MALAGRALNDNNQYSESSLNYSVIQSTCKLVTLFTTKHSKVELRKLVQSAVKPLKADGGPGIDVLDKRLAKRVSDALQLK